MPLTLLPSLPAWQVDPKLAETASPEAQSALRDSLVGPKKKKGPSPKAEKTKAAETAAGHDAGVDGSGTEAKRSLKKGRGTGRGRGRGRGRGKVNGPVYGCSRCRGSPNGCTQCRKPGYTARGPRGKQLKAAESKASKKPAVE